MRSDLHHLIRDLRKQGYTVEQRKGRTHYRVYQGDKMVATMPSTPSCPRWLQNLRADLKRAGVTL